MEFGSNPVEMIQFIPQPAFLVEDGIITSVNNAASERHIKTGSAIIDLITLGAGDYKNFVSGKLYLELNAGRAWVSVCEKKHLFCMEDSYSSPELRAFALAAQHLRIPLATAISGTELLMQNETLNQASELKVQLGQINRSLYQMIRAVCNMSDVSQLGSAYNTKFEIRDVTSVFSEIFERATVLLENTKRTLTFRNLKSSIQCSIDEQLLERAILNLITNAIKFSPEDSTIQATLKQNGNRLTLTVENDIQDGRSGMYGNAFSRFLREPGIASGQMGIGLGMTIISQAVSAHKGTILLDTAKKNAVRIIVSIPVRSEIEQELKSPMILVDGYTGGIDSFLVELSEVLPSKYYEFT